MGLPTFPRGIHPREAKDITRDRPIRRLPFAPYLVLFLSQHAGKPSKAIVRDGERVRRGDKIAEADGFVSVPLYAPATGTVKAVTRSLNFDGKMADAIVIEPDPASPQDIPARTRRDPDSLSRDEIVRGVQEMGMVGLGGAAFPTHVKLTPPKGKSVDTLILNGCECEPYLTSDHRVMVERPELVLLGARLLARALGAKRTIVAVESNKPEALAALRSAPGADDLEIRELQTKYPQGAEKMLTKALLDREIPSGGLPADIGVLVSNVATAAEIGELLPEGRGLIERVVTVTGRGVARPGNYLVPLGTPLDFLLESVGFSGTAKQVIFGGPMMGKAVVFLETPTTKGLTGIVVMDEGELTTHGEALPCIRCGECVRACPMGLNPSRLGLHARRGSYDSMKEDYHLLDCFECGCCSYVCPSDIPLVQLFRTAKGVLRKTAAKAK
jgi:electron transport complex protein RnfC